MALTNATALAADIQTYFDKALLPHAEKTMVYKQFGQAGNIPAGNSKTISWTQYAKLTPPAGNLTEGVTPTENALTSSAITATADQMGDYIILTDLAELTVKHPVVQESLKILGMQAGETVDGRIRTVLQAATNVNYAGTSNAARNDLEATDYLTTTDILRAKTQLQNAGAQPFDGGKYVAIVDPSVMADIVLDSNFLEAHKYENHTPLYNGEAGEWMGVRFVVTTNGSTDTNATSVVVHHTIVVGRNSYAVTNLQNLTTIMEGPGGVSDPLRQRRTLGWKVSFKSAILNQNWLRRIESASRF